MTPRQRLRRLWAVFAVAALCLPALPIPLASADLGGTVGRVPHFTNVTESTGTGALLTVLTDLEFIRERNAAFINGGKGAAWFDYNNDGWEDLLVGGFQHRLLYRNNGDGTFTEVIAQTGLGGTLYSMGILTPDLTNDGYPDVVFVNWFNRSELFINNGDGTFYNATRTWNFYYSGPSTGLAFGDLDGDGWGDLYIASYYKRNAALFRNMGGRALMDMGDQAGIRDLTDQTFQPLIFDYDLDGDLDIYEANDFGPDDMYRNDGNWTFTDVSDAVGLNTLGDGMGAAIGDVNGDGYMDIFVTNFAYDYWLVYNATTGAYKDQHVELNISDPEVGWGVQTMDFNNDGYLDVFVADGVVIQGQPAEADKLYINRGDNTFFDASGEAGVKDWGTNRGSAAADYNKDGSMDLWVSNILTNSSMYRNEAPFNHWLEVELEGVVSVKQAVGARLTVEAGGRTQYRQVHMGSSYLTQDTLVQHVGLGGAATVDKLTIDWPSGAHQEFTDVAADQRLHIVEYEGNAPTSAPSDAVGDAGAPVYFDGTNSTDDTRLFDYRWTFSDPLPNLTLTGPTPQYTFYQPLNITGNLTVTDGFGNTDTKPFRLVVRPAGHPLVDAGPDVQGQPGAPVDLSATLKGPTVPPDYPNVTFSWMITGNGGPWFLSGRNVSHTFALPGEYLATVNATDASFQSGFDTLRITVGDPEPPVIVFVAPTSVPEDTPFILDASASTDNDPSFATTGSYYWRVSAPQGQFEVHTGSSPEFTINNPGPAVFELEVSDASNNTAAMRFTVLAIDGTPPTADGGSDRVVSAGSTVRLDASNSSDNDPDLFARGTFEWTFTGPDGPMRAYGPLTEVVVTNPGATQVRLNVRDPSGNAAVPDDAFTITAVDTKAPTMDILPDVEVTLGRSVTFSAGEVSDNDPAFATTANYTWSFRDGAAPRVLYGSRVDYLFGAVGNYRVDLTVRDAAANSARENFTTRVVDGDPPSIHVTVVESALVGEAVEFNASACTDNVGVVSYSWTFDPPTEVAVLSGQYVRWTFANAGNYTVTLTIADKAGNTATAEYTIEVRAAPTPPPPPNNGTTGGTNNNPPVPSTELSALGWVLIAASAAGAVTLFYRLRQRRA